MTFPDGRTSERTDGCHEMTTYKKRDEGLLWHSSKQDKKEPGMETNKDTRIYLLSRCVELKYAERLLYQGSLFFSYPIKWIKEGQKGNDGQGDALEGVCSNEINFRNVFLRKRARLVRGKKGWYLRSRNIENNWLCVCFFSASDMTKKRQDGDTLVFDMSEAYAKAFSGEETWENRFKKRCSFGMAVNGKDIRI